MVALIRNTKAGREESRYLSIEAVWWLKARWGHTEIRGSDVSQITPRGTLGQSAIAAQEVVRIIQRVGRLLNIARDSTERAWPSEHISAYSTRIGAAHGPGRQRH
jgi:hypothetical protein